MILQKNTKNLIQVISDIYNTFNPTIINFNSNHKDIPIKKAVIKKKDFTDLNSKIRRILIEYISHKKCIYKNYNKFDYSVIEKNLLNYLNKNYDKTIYPNSKSWSHIYEILTYFKLTDNKRLISFHLYENAGDTVNSLNHYVTNKTDIKTFIWFANSSNNNDDFKEYLKKMDYSFNFGNLNVHNIISYSKKYIGSDLIIASYSFKDESYDEYLLELIFILETLNNGGNLIFKYDIRLLYEISLDIIYISYKNFENLYLFDLLWQ